MRCACTLPLICAVHAPLYAGIEVGGGGEGEHQEGAQQQAQEQQGGEQDGQHQQGEGGEGEGVGEEEVLDAEVAMGDGDAEGAVGDMGDA